MSNQLLDYEQLPKILFNNIKEGEYYLNDDFLPQKKGRYWMRIVISPEQKIYYSNDELVITTKNNGGIYRHVQLTEEIHELLYSLPMVFYKNILDYNNKSVNENKNIAKPHRSDGEFLYFIMDDGRKLRANMDTLNGIGILPNGNVIIGYGKENPQYYYDLLILREKYQIAKEAKRNETELNGIKLNEYNKNKIVKKQDPDENDELNNIKKEAYDIIKKQNPDESGESITKRFFDGWLNIPDDYYQIYDVTNEINNILESYINSEEWQELKSKYWGELYYKYFSEAYTNNAMDLKNNPEWYHPLYIYDGEILDVDAFGNIILAFVGAFLGFNVQFLHIVADAVQKGESIVKEFSNLNIDGIIYNETLDDPRDYYRIEQGYNLYFEMFGDN